jgi:DMATS type aromatic prenyltransferase
MRVMADLSLREHTIGQLRRLCQVSGLAEAAIPAGEIMGTLIGAAGESAIPGTPPFLSHVADDSTPVEFSLAFEASGEHVVRVLGEAVGGQPDRWFVDALADRMNLRTDRFDAVQDLFLAGETEGVFALWYSLIVRPDSPLRLKVYANPQSRGPELAGPLVAEGLRRLGINRAYETVVTHALTRGELDWFSFFAVDLDNGPQARVKLYVSHEAADSAVVERAAGLLPGVDLLQIREFCAILGGGKGPFTGRPLITSYSFVGDDPERPGVYSLYLPIRDYVPDDEVARLRVLTILAQYNIDSSVLDHAIAAVTDRPLRDGVGLIAHVSLRLGDSGSGITVYLSSEAYGVTPPRSRSVLGLVPAN